MKASGKRGGEVGGGTEKRAGKTGSVSSGRGRGGESEPPEWDLLGGGSQASPHGECFSTWLLSSLPCEAGLNTPEEMGRDESTAWGGNGPSWGWLKTETKTGKCPQSEVYLSQWSCTDRFQGVREPDKNVFKVVYRWPFFFSSSGEESQSFHHIFQRVCDSPKVKSGLSRGP